MLQVEVLAECRLDLSFATLLEPSTGRVLRVQSTKHVCCRVLDRTNFLQDLIFSLELSIQSITSSCCDVMPGEGEEGTRTRLGYTFVVKERDGRALVITPCQGITEGCMAHPGFANCKFVHTGITSEVSNENCGKWACQKKPLFFPDEGRDRCRRYYSILR